MEIPIAPIDKNESFCFTCSPDSPCFNECCRDLNQFLTPYDILKLKQHLDMTSDAFLETYTSESTGPNTGLPIIYLKPDYRDHMKCPFVTESGCRVYPARPSSCRTYPLARAVSRSRETGERTEHWAVMREEHCKGFENGKSQTVQDWIDDQKIEEYNEMNDEMMELIALKNSTLSGPLDMMSRKIFHMALYDLDTFRSHVFEKNLLNNPAFVVDKGELENAKTNDLALLKIGMRWVKFKIFGMNDNRSST